MLGILKEESVVKKDNGKVEMAWKERSVTTYDDHFRPLTNKKYVGIYGSPRTLCPRSVGSTMTMVM